MDSITELVKIVAREVVAKELQQFKSEIEAARETHSVTKAAVSKMMGQIQSRLAVWTEEEDSLLAAELQVAIATIAKTHRRSLIGIECRIKKVLRDRNFK